MELHHYFLLILATFLSYINNLGAQEDFTFGACEPGKESCQECYLMLVKELLGNDENVFNLSYVFTSPVRDEPSAVVVNYHFRFDNGTDKVDTWFWAQSGAYILHPLFIFQFITLFFGNPKPIYEQIVHVTLNGTECHGVHENLKHMTLLTQRLNAYLDEQRINPRIPDSYSAVAVNSETFEQVINNISDSTLHISRKDVLIAHPTIALGGTMFVMITVLIIYGRCGGSIQKRLSIGLSIQAKATIVSICFISIGRIIIFIGLDIGAIIVRELGVDPQVQSIYHSGKHGSLNDIMYNIPVTLLVFDGVALLVCGGIILFVTYLIIETKTKYKDSYYYVLVLTVVPLIFSAYSHAPYIIMAYVSDASYASSIFIYYVIAIFVEFGVLEYTFSTVSLFKKVHKSIGKCCGLLLLASLLSLAINSTMTVIFTFYFFIPIKYALRRAPSEVLVIYQSAIILVGGYITYKAVFYKDELDQQNAAIKNANCKAKEKEIKTLEQEITHLMRDENTNQVKIMFLWKKISHLRVEIQLQCLHSRFISTLDCPVNLVEKDKIINDLYTQQYQLLNYLIAEITVTNPTASKHQEQESRHLKVEVFTHLKCILSQFWREPHRSRIIERFGNRTIQEIINYLPDLDMPDEIMKLNKEINQVEEINSNTAFTGQQLQNKQGQLDQPEFQYLHTQQQVACMW